MKDEGNNGFCEAEAKAREFIKKRHSRVRRIFFRTMYKEEDSWMLNGEVQFKRAYLFVTQRSFRLQVKSETGEVTSYEEHAVSRCKRGKMKSDVK